MLQWLALVALVVAGCVSAADAQQAPDQLPFVTTWKTDTANQTIAIPLVGSGMTVHWGDGTSSTGISETVAHTYANPGTHTVSVYGALKPSRWTATRMRPSSCQ